MAGEDRTEEASPKRRSDFRKKGQVAMSKEAQTAALFTIGLLFWVLYLPMFWENLKAFVFILLQSMGEYKVSADTLPAFTLYIVKHMAILLAPPCLVLAVVAVFSCYFQIGWLFTTKPLKPDLKKFDIINGMKRFVSKRSLMEVVKSLLKVGLIGYVGFSTLFNNFEEALALIDAPLPSTLAFIGKVAFFIFIKICIVMIILAIIDILYVRWEHEKQMKMTKQEQKEEFKQTEGDPQVKSKIRAIQQQMAQSRMMSEIPTADVVVTNPTHISTALRYNPGEMSAPILVAKGKDQIALKIREIAREHEVPVIENPPVARLLHELELGEHIPEDMFKVVAEILAHVYSLRGNKRQ